MAGRVAGDRRQRNSSPPTWFQQAYHDMPSWKKTLLTIVGLVLTLGAAGVMGYLLLRHGSIGILPAAMLGGMGFVGLFLAFPKGAIYLVELSPRIAGLLRRERRRE